MNAAAIASGQYRHPTKWNAAANYTFGRLPAVYEYQAIIAGNADGREQPDIADSIVTNPNFGHSIQCCSRRLYPTKAESLCQDAIGVPPVDAGKNRASLY